MLDILLTIQLVCGFQSHMDSKICEMQIHSCYREYKKHNVSDEFALKKCVVKR